MKLDYSESSRLRTLKNTPANMISPIKNGFVPNNEYLKIENKNSSLKTIEFSNNEISQSDSRSHTVADTDNKKFETTQQKEKP